MSLGPGKLSPVHRVFINRREARLLIAEFLSGTIIWSDPKLSDLKNNIRLSLRKQQCGRCIFCRRIIKEERRNTTEDIEHFLDKSKVYYKKWAFHPMNLSIACHSCNFVKSTKQMGDINIQRAQYLVPGIGVFRWLHPYFDDYHENISIEKGWVYRIADGAPNHNGAENLIRECELSGIANIERNAEDYKLTCQRLLKLAIACAAKGQITRMQKLQLSLQELMESKQFDF